MILNDTSNTFVWFSNVLCIHISRMRMGYYRDLRKITMAFRIILKQRIVSNTANLTVWFPCLKSFLFCIPGEKAHLFQYLNEAPSQTDLFLSYPLFVCVVFLISHKK